MLNIGALSNIHFQQPITVSHAFYTHSHYAISYRSVYEKFEGKTAHHAVISVSDRVSLHINLQFDPINFRGGIMTSNAVRRFIKIYGALWYYINRNRTTHFRLTNHFEFSGAPAALMQLPHLALRSYATE